jgi:UDP-galactopyranose mutase
MTASRSDSYDVLVVGAGYAGSVTAERLASQCDLRCLVIDRRDHIAGNAFDYLDRHGVLVHKYGPHIFHTKSKRVVDYLDGFTEWRPYEHHVVADLGGRTVPLPINRNTINELYGLSLETEEEVEAFYAERREPIDHIRNSEDAVVAKVGREIYETFFRGYTRKQWQRDPSELNASVCARIPLRTTADNRYFDDWHQAMPADGYTAMFERFLAHPNIDVRLGTAFEDVRDQVRYAQLVWTGPIDEYFGYRFGKLPYRSLEFELRTVDTAGGGYALPAGSVNYPSEDVPHTRVTEFRRLSGQDDMPKSTLAYEYPRSEGDPYYPIPRDDTRELYRRYEALADELPEVTFVGRLARYQYLNMDQVVGQALATFDRLLEGGLAARLAA